MECQERLKRLRNKLVEEKCQAFLVDDPINLYYLTGIELSTGTLIVDLQNAHLFVDGRYIEMCKKKTSIPVLLTTANRSALQLWSEKQKGTSHIGFSSELTSYKKYTELKKLTEELKQNKGLKLDLVPTQNILEQLRSIKEPAEIQLLREAAILGSKGFDFVCTHLREGVTEVELATELEIYWKREGAKQLGFDSIIAFGANSSMPHYRPSDVQLKKSDSVLIDIGVNLRHYHSDMTRVVYFGKPHPKMLEIHGVVQEAQKRALALCKPGTKAGEIDQAARQWISRAGYGENFSHGLGHGVGLQIHELPVLKNVAPDGDVILQPGMVVTVEPGIYLPGLGGVRIEDTVVITASGHEDLTLRPTDPLII